MGLLDRFRKKTVDAEQLAKEVDMGPRSPRGWGRYLIFIVAVSMSLFHLYTGGAGLLTAMKQRSVHLTFALFLAFVVYPFSKRSPRDKIPWYDLLLGLIAAFTAFYHILFYNQLTFRVGAPNTIDLVMGGLFILLVLEATRRSIGPALPIIAIAFILYAMFGPYMPGILAHKGYSIKRIINHQYMTMQGILGVPVGVSATFVFLFVLFGSLLDKAGAGEYFIKLAFSLLGKFRGGPAKAAVVSSALMGMVSGSSIANVVTTGTFTIPLMKKVGFEPATAGAVEVATSTNGQLMPPVMGAAAFIMAEFLGISYFQVVKAAFIPAVISYIALFYIVHLEALKLGIRGLSEDEVPKFWPTFWSGIHFLIPVFVLIYALVIKRLTPITSAFLSIVLIIVLLFIQGPIKVFFSYKKGSLGEMSLIEGIYYDFIDNVKKLFAGFEAAARNMIGIAVACASAGIIIGVTTLTGLGLRMTDIILTISGGHLFFTLILTMIASIILGMGLPTTATYIVLAALTAPAITALDPTIPAIAAHLFVFFFGIIADDTPPVGLAAYAAAAIAKSDPIKTGVRGFGFDIRTAILPFLFVYHHELLLIGTTFWQGVLVFILATIGMLLFSAGLQGYFITRSKLWESLMLLVAGLMIIQPKWDTTVMGVVVVAFVYLLQRRRAVKEAMAA